MSEPFEIGRISSLDEDNPLSNEFKEILDSIIAREGLQYCVLIQTLFSLSNCDNAEIRSYDKLVRTHHLKMETAKGICDARNTFMRQLIGLMGRAWLGTLDISHDTNVESERKFMEFMDKIDTDLTMLDKKQEEYKSIRGVKR